MKEALGRLARHPLPWILLFAALIRWQSTGFMRSSDDLDYAMGALDLLEGRFNPESFHQLRWGMILPAALSFALFGVRHWAAVLWPMASSLLSIAVLYAVAARRSSRPVAILAALFLSVSTQHALSGAELFPDAPLTLWALLAFFLYLEEREGPRRPLRYALAGVCLYAALATRIETLKLLPAFAAIEVWYARRRNTDSRVWWIAAGLGIPLLLEMAVFGVLRGNPFERVREVTAVREWSASSGSQGMGLWVMVKSLVSPFGAFGILFLPACAGAARAWRDRRLGPVLFLAAYLLGTTLAMAALYRIADGRHYAMISPLVAWLAAELVAAVPRPKLRIAAAAGATLAGTLLFHTRLPSDTMRAYREIHETLAGTKDPVYSDPRTVGALTFYFPGHRVSSYAGATLTAPCWLIDNPGVRAVDRSMYGVDAYPGDTGSLVRTVAVGPRGLPGVMPVVRVLFKWRGVGGIGSMRVFRIER